MGKKKLPLYILLCYLMSFNSGLQMSGQQYVLLDMRTEFGISNATMALITSVQFFVFLTMSLIFSQILDKISNKKLVLFGGSIAITGSLINGFSIGPTTTIAAFIVASFGSSVLMAVPYPAFAQLDPDNITRHVNVQQGALSFGAVLSPLLLSVLIGKLGLDWRWNYRISAGLMSILIVMFALVKPGVQLKSKAQRENTRRAKDLPEEKKRLIFTPVFMLIALTLGVYMFIEIGILNYSKEYFTRGLGDILGASLCISIVRASMTVTRIFGSRLVKNRVSMCVGSFALSGVSLLLLALFPIKGVALLWCALFGLFAGPCWPTIFSIGLDLDRNSPGKLTSVMMVMNNLGMNLGSFVIGSAVDTLGVQNAFYVSAGVALAGIMVFLLAIRFFRKSGRLPEGKAWQDWKAARAEEAAG